ncbi:MAG TPA: MMPL family transporter, partial [Solirubrobacteraceae bacterium]|nr:MMPL family transporter [Solirubrobacteraceae bacterium]
LGRYTATHFRTVLAGWLVVALVLGFFAPRVEKALSGAGWEASGSQSAQARKLVERDFAGMGSYGLMTVVYSPTQTVGSPAFKSAVARVEQTLRADRSVRTVVAPAPGLSISRDGHTAIVQAGAARDPNGMVAAADTLKGRLHKLSTAGVVVNLTGAAGMWSDFNAANRSAMLKSEVISWPVTLGIMLLAFGSLVAAGLPLMLTMVGLLSAAGLLYLGTLISPISIWAMNFALMFALALGIDYALFIVMRFRGAFFGSKLDAQEATAVTMDTAGKAVLFSGVTVLISLTAVMLVPSPAFRSMSLGIMLAVIFVLAATLTLMPAVLAKLGPKVDNISLPWAHSSEHRSPVFAAWGERLWRHPLRYGAPALVVLLALAYPVTQLKTSMPSIKVVPTTDSSRVGYNQVQAAMGPGSTGPLQLLTSAGKATTVARIAQSDPGVAQVLPTQLGGGGLALVTAVPRQDPSNPAVGATIERLRAHEPAGTLLGGAVAENHDLQHLLSAKTALVVGVVLALGFLLLLVALQAPLLAAAGVLTNLLATGAAFGVSKWIFQDGALHSLLGFQPQGFLDAWGPVFFFAMIFAISMDYTVFLLSSAKEHWDRTGDAREAMVGGLAHSGRVIFAAAAVMVAVFFTFAISGPLPPKEMGIILGVAVLLDATLIRLLLLPVLLRLMGRRAWYLPRWARRVLPDVRFGHS